MHTLCQVIPTKWRTYGDHNISPYVYERLVWISCKISSIVQHIPKATAARFRGHFPGRQFHYLSMRFTSRRLMFAHVATEPIALLTAAVCCAVFYSASIVQRSIVMCVSVCLRSCVSAHEHISGITRAISPFVHVARWVSECFDLYSA